MRVIKLSPKESIELYTISRKRGKNHFVSSIRARIVVYLIYYYTFSSKHNDRTLDKYSISKLVLESSRKTSISALLTMPKPLIVWITINCGKF